MPTSGKRAFIRTILDIRNYGEVRVSVFEFVFHELPGLRHLLANCGFPLEKIVTGYWGNRACVRQAWLYRPTLFFAKMSK